MRGEGGREGGRRAKGGREGEREGGGREDGERKEGEEGEGKEKELREGRVVTENVGQMETESEGHVYLRTTTELERRECHIGPMDETGVFHRIDNVSLRREPWNQGGYCLVG